MKILITHSSSFDFKERLYQPLKNSFLIDEHEIILPQEGNERKEITADTIKSCDLVVAEASLPSTGQGAELGQAHLFDIPVVCIYEEGADISKSLDKITDIFIEYKNSDELIKKLGKEVKRLN